MTDPIKNEGSVYDDYDEEEGYNDEVILEKGARKNLILLLYRSMIENGVSYNEAQKTDFCKYVDFLVFCLDNPREEKGGE